MMEIFQSPQPWSPNFFYHHLLVCHCGLAIYIEEYLKEEKKNGNSNISHAKM